MMVILVVHVASLQEEVKEEVPPDGERNELNCFGVKARAARAVDGSPSGTPGLGHCNGWGAGWAKRILDTHQFGGLVKDFWLA